MDLKKVNCAWTLGKLLERYGEEVFVEAVTELLNTSQVTQPPPDSEYQILLMPVGDYSIESVCEAARQSLEQALTIDAIAVGVTDD